MTQPVRPEVLARRERRLPILVGALVAGVCLGAPLGAVYSLARTVAALESRPPAPPRVIVARDVCGDRLEIRATVARAVAQFRLAGDPASVLRSARIVPRAGQGLKVYAIRPDSPLSAIGLRNGDLIVRVSGVPVDTSERALAAYGLLRDAPAPSVTFELMRRGCPATLVVSLV